MTARVSIVVPHYGPLEYLDDCLRSLVAQTESDWEAIVVDDACPSGSAHQLVTTLGDRRIRVIRHPENRGLGAARNTGFVNAASDLVVPVDADDRLDPEYLAATVSLIESTEADCVFTDFQLFGDSDDVWESSDGHTLRDMLMRQWIPGPGTLMHRRVWEAADGYPTDGFLRGNEDWSFWIAALAAGVRPLHLARPLYFYRRHGLSMSSTFLSAEEFSQRQALYERHRDLYDSLDLGPEFIARGYIKSGRYAWEVGRKRDALRLVGGLVARPRASTAVARVAVRAAHRALRGERR